MSHFLKRFLQNLVVPLLLLAGGFFFLGGAAFLGTSLAERYGDGWGVAGVVFWFTFWVALLVTITEETC